MQTVFHHVLPLAMTLYTLFAIYTINMLFGYFFEARSRSHMDSLFGQYVLSPDVFRILGDHIRANVRERGEFQLTTALEQMRHEAGFRAYVVQGRRFDTGLPGAYLETLNAFYGKGERSREG